MTKKSELIKSYTLMLEEDDVESYETPNGTTFVLDGIDTWYNADKPSEILTTKKLAERCAAEELD